MALSKSSKNTINILVKGIILVLAFVFIWRKLTDNQHLSDFLNMVKSMRGPNVYVIVGLVSFLMFFNWLVEAAKWQFLVERIEHISFWRAVESVFCGLTWAIFTPNRIGEYGGRVFFLSPRKRVRGIVAMAVGGAGQLLLTNVLGGSALIWFIFRFVPLNPWLYALITLILLLFCSFFILFYFNIRLVNTVLLRLRFLKSLHRFFIVFTWYKTPDLLKIFWYSLGRFAVFTFQYYLVIHLFIPQLPAFDIVMMVFIVLFVQSSIPSVNVLDLGIRSMTATFFFGYITHQDLAIMASSAFIWLVNLIIPAILGSVFVLKLKFFDAPAH